MNQIRAIMQGAKQLSFLPEPKYNPRYPAKATLASKALRLMLSGSQITHPQFEALTGCWRLAAHIHILKSLGWPVQRQAVPGIPYTDSENERKKSMCMYYLPDDLLSLMSNS